MIWHFKSKSSGVEYAIELALRWEVPGGAAGDYLRGGVAHRSRF